MTDKLTIKLGERSFEISPLTLGQLEDLSAAVSADNAPDPEVNVRRSFRRTLGAIAAALSEEHPDMTEQALRKLRCSRRDMMDAYNAVLLHSGLTGPRSAYGVIVETGDLAEAVALLERFGKEGLRVRPLPPEDRKPAGEPPAPSSAPTGNGSSAN